MNKAQIHPRQLFALIVLFELGSAIVVGLGLQAKQDAWLAILLGMMGGLVLLTVYLYLYKQFPDQTLTGYLMSILGIPLGSLIGVAYFLYFIYIAARVLRDFGELLVTSALPVTPLYAVNGLMLLLVGWSVILGIDVVGRVGEIVSKVLALVGISAFLLITFSDIIHPQYLQPVLEEGWKRVLTTAFPLTLTFPFGEMIVFTMIFPVLQQRGGVSQAAYRAVVLSGVILMITIMIELVILGVQAAEIQQFPLLSAMGKINVGTFIQRMDAIALSVLICGGYFKITIFTFAGATAAAEVFRVKDKKQYHILVATLCFLVLTFSLGMSSNFSEHIFTGLKMVPKYLHLPLQAGVPILLAIIVAAKRRMSA